MNRQTLFLIGLALVLAAVYVACFSDWLKPKSIHIYSRMAPGKEGVVVFYLDKPYPLQSIEVVATDDARTNKHPHSLWHIVAQSKSAPMARIAYGEEIPGMKPDVPSARPEPLDPDVDYSLLLETGSGLKGEKSFKAP